MATLTPTAHQIIEGTIPQVPPVRALDLKAVEQKVSFKESRIRDLIARNEFPQPVKLGGRKNLWLEAEVDAWILAQFAKRPEVQKRA